MDRWLIFIMLTLAIVLTFTITKSVEAMDVDGVWLDFTAYDFKMDHKKADHKIKDKSHPVVVDQVKQKNTKQNQLQPKQRIDKKINSGFFEKLGDSFDTYVID